MLAFVVQSDMKRGERTASRAAQEEMSAATYERVNEGEPPVAISASFGMHRGWANKIRAKAKGCGKGKRASKSARGSGRSRKLDAAQQCLMPRWINGKNPMQCEFEFAPWTRQTVRDQIKHESTVKLNLTSVSTLLAKFGLTMQKPLQRAYQRDPEAVEQWQNITYRQIEKTSRKVGADICVWHESSFRADAVQGMTWSEKGQAPVVGIPGQRQSISAATAVSSKGGFWFSTYPCALNGELFMTLLKQMMHGRRKPLHLVFDGLPALKTKAVREHVDGLKGKLTSHFLPGYAPDLNPNDLVWSHTKQTGRTRRPLRTGETLADRVSVRSCRRSHRI